MKNILFGVIATLLIVGVGAGFYYLGNKRGSISTFSKPTSAPFVEVTSQPALLTPTPISTQKIRGGGIMLFPKYELTAMGDWQLTRENDTDMEKITLSKNGYELSIVEGGFGGAACLYSGDEDIQGPSARYENFVEITGKSGDLFRRSWNEEGKFGICQKTQYGWGAPTLFGNISYKIPTPYSPEMVSEMDAILASITRI